VDCARVARAHNFIELLEVIIMVREVFFHRSRAFIGMVFIFFFTFDSEKRNRKIGVKDVGK